MLELLGIGIIAGGLYMGLKAKKVRIPAGLRRVRYSAASARKSPDTAGASSAGFGPLTDLIRRAEAGPKGYDAIWHGIAVADHPPKPVSQMTIGEVLDWQDSIDAKYNSEAVGLYQFMEDTLRRVYSKAGLSRASLFSPANQDAMALELAAEKGLNEFLAGRKSTVDFGNGLSRVWAGLPSLSSQTDPRGRPIVAGESYYKHYGGNRATVGTQDVMAALNRLKGGTTL